jgi:cobalamin-dependent methionine synthase I
MDDYFLTELVLAGIAIEEASAVTRPYLALDKERGKGPVLIAAVKGDNHDIGKTISGVVQNYALAYSIYVLNSNYSTWENTPPSLVLR